MPKPSHKMIGKKSLVEKKSLQELGQRAREAWEPLCLLSQRQVLDIGELKRTVVTISYRSGNWRPWK